MELYLANLLDSYKGTQIVAPIAIGVRAKLKQTLQVLHYDCHCGSDDCSDCYNCHCGSDDCSDCYDCHCGPDDCVGDCIGPSRL